MRLPVALVQLDATGDVEANIDRAIALAAEAAAGGARLVVLPEYLHYRGDDDGFRASARPIPGPFTEAFAEVARRHNAWILAGSVAETSDDPGCPYNTSVLLDPNGSIAATYRKIHLFDVSVDDGPVDTESARVSPGDTPVVADVDGVRLGLSVCYDLRFPEPDRTLALAGAEPLRCRPTSPSAPAATIGRCCSARERSRTARGSWPWPVGRTAGATSFGRSMVIDPWGTVVAQASDGVGIIRADVETDRVAAVRRQIPSLANRRPEAYRLT